jgi:ATP-dependent DNA helicase RecG
MNLAELKKLVSGGETERVEFKRTTGERVEAAKTTCALLNATGGFVLFGVADDGRIKGQQVSESTYRDIQGEMDKIEPPAFPDVETVSVGKGLSVIVLRIPGEGGPYTYDGRAYYRQGTSTRRMPQPRYERRLLERMHAGRRWENQPAERLTLKDLDRSEVVRTVDEAVRNRRMEAPASRNLKDLLVHLGLLEGDRLLNAAIVLFAKPDKILPNYPQCLLRMARFKGVDKTEFIDNRQEFGNAFDLFIRAQRFLRDHLPVAGRILPNVFKREDDPLYPPAALREAVANAICHRDYAITGGSIGIAIYDDRLEIESIGPLPFDVTPESLLRPHRSQPWNPILSSVFYRRGIIEHWGRGTLKMRELCAEAGLPPPEFEASKGDVVVRFRPPRGKGHMPIQSTAQAFAEVAAQVPRKYPESTQEVTLEVEVILPLCQHPASRQEIQAQLGLRDDEHFRKAYLLPALATGLIERTIPYKPRSSKQRYRITEKGKAWLERR